MSYLGKVRPTVALTSSDIVDGAITTDKIVDDAVTDVKVANAINTSIAANTAKVTNATHTGDVTGATALTIAADAVDIAMLSATGTADATTFLRGDNSWTAAGGDNTPSFQARNTSAQASLTQDTFYKVEYNTEDWDTDSAYDHSTNYRFTVPTGEGGKYCFHAQCYCMTDARGYLKQSKMYFYKNGVASIYAAINDRRGANSNEGDFTNNVHVDAIIGLVETDYIEVYITIATQSGDFEIDNNRGYFSGYKLIGV